MAVIYTFVVVTFFHAVQLPLLKALTYIFAAVSTKICEYTAPDEDGCTL